jgi:hypothetical protein
MKRFNHILIANTIDKEFGLTSYSKGKFIFFVKDGCEIGFIEQIAKTSTYLKTIYSSFFYFEDQSLNIKLANRIKELYKEQSEKITVPQNTMLAFANEGIANELI